MLKDTKLSPDFAMTSLAEHTEGFSGSDLRELCRNAAMVPVREYVRSSSDNADLLAKGQLEACGLPFFSSVAKTLTFVLFCAGLQSAVARVGGFLCT